MPFRAHPAPVGAKPNGFSLLEMMVALAVFSIAALALIKLQAASLSQTVALDQRLYSEIVARNLVVERLTDPRPPALGSDSGSVENGGRRFEWQSETSPVDAAMVRVDITVSAADAPAVTLTLYRPAEG